MAGNYLQSTGLTYSRFMLWFWYYTYTRERERVYSPNKHNIRYNTIAKTQWQAAREAKYAHQAGHPYGNITSVTQYIKRKRTQTRYMHNKT